MKSGLEDRNNADDLAQRIGEPRVSMKSGLEDRNNEMIGRVLHRAVGVSMKSGLEDRNNNSRDPVTRYTPFGSQ